MIDGPVAAAMLRKALKRRGITNRQVSVTNAQDHVVALIKAKNVYESFVREEIDRIHGDWCGNESSAFISIQWDRNIVLDRVISLEELLDEITEKAEEGGYVNHRSPVSVFYRKHDGVYEVKCIGREGAVFFKDEDEMREFIAKRFLERGL